MAPVAIVKEALDKLEPTVTDDGMLNALEAAGNVVPVIVEVAVRDIIAPPEGAAPDRVTVQVLLVLGPSTVGLHCSEEIDTEASTERLVLCEDPL
jgi:hypothetical protein